MNTCIFIWSKPFNTFRTTTVYETGRFSFRDPLSFISIPFFESFSMKGLIFILAMSWPVVYKAYDRYYNHMQSSLSKTHVTVRRIISFAD